MTGTLDHLTYLRGTESRVDNIFLLVKMVYSNRIHSLIYYVVCGVIRTVYLLLMFFVVITEYPKLSVILWTVVVYSTPPLHSIQFIRFQKRTRSFSVFMNVIKQISSNMK